MHSEVHVRQTVMVLLGLPVNLRISCVMECITSCSVRVSMYSDSWPAIQPQSTCPYLRTEHEQEGRGERTGRESEGRDMHSGIQKHNTIWVRHSYSIQHYYSVGLTDLSVGLSTVKPNSFFIQNFSTSDTWSTRSTLTRTSMQLQVTYSMVQSISVIWNLTQSNSVSGVATCLLDRSARSILLSTNRWGLTSRLSWNRGFLPENGMCSS